MQIQKGDIFLADFTDGIGSEQSGMRPCVVVSNNIGNKFSPCIIVALITSKENKPNLPTHVSISAFVYGLPKASIILCEQIRTIDKKRLKNYIGALDSKKMQQLNEAVKISFELD